MADDFLKDRTFQLHFDQKAFPDFAVQSQCGSGYRRPDAGFDFHALQIDKDTLRPIVLKWKDQNFQAVATPWELKNSAILNHVGLTPIVDDEAVVVGYLGNKDPVATHMRPIVDVDGQKVREWWDEPPLQSSLVFEVGTALVGGFGTRALVKGALRKATAAAPGIIKLTGTLKGPLLKSLLRKRIVPKRLPDIQQSFEYGPWSGTVPNFHAQVTTHVDGVLYQISYQVTKDCGTAGERLLAAQMRTKAIRFAAEQAKLRGEQTFKMRIKEANQASREAAERLLLKAGNPQVPRRMSSGGSNPTLEWVLETEKVLTNVH